MEKTERNVLLSIKPVYVSMMRDGKKLCEFRRVMPRQCVGYVFVYESSPVKKITGMFSGGIILEAPLDDTWKKCASFGGITRQGFDTYFSGLDMANAFCFESFVPFPDPLDPRLLIPHFLPPQNFAYLDTYPELAEWCEKKIPD